MHLCLEREKEYFLSRRDDQCACSGNRTSPSFGHRAPRGLSRDQLVLTVSCCFVKQLSPAVCRVQKKVTPAGREMEAWGWGRKRELSLSGWIKVQGRVLKKVPFHPPNPPIPKSILIMDSGCANNSYVTSGLTEGQPSVRKGSQGWSGQSREITRHVSSWKQEVSSLTCADTWR